MLWRTAFERKLAAQNISNSLRAKNQLIFIQNRASKKIVSFFKSVQRYRLCLRATLSLQKWFRAYTPLMRARILNRGFKRLQVRTLYKIYILRLLLSSAGTSTTLFAVHWKWQSFFYFLRVYFHFFIYLQAFFRAYKLRTVSNVKVSNALKRIKVANSRAVGNPLLRLGKQTEGSSDIKCPIEFNLFHNKAVLI